MALPPLRQPKLFTHKEIKSGITDESKKTSKENETKLIIVTLKNQAKLVVTSDAYHGILTAGEKFVCVFCDVDINIEGKGKELHKVSKYHNKTLDASPFVEEYMTNLVRRINADNYYCTTCNVIVKTYFIIRHLSSDVHCQELEKAKNKSSFYKASNK